MTVYNETEYNKLLTDINNTLYTHNYKSIKVVGIKNLNNSINTLNIYIATEYGNYIIKIDKSEFIHTTISTAFIIGQKIVDKYIYEKSLKDMEVIDRTINK